jgi:SAM-dependent methyltransferase
MEDDGVRCPVCGARDPRIFLDLPALPVLCNRLWPTREEARSAPRGDLHLGHCPVCSHVFNARFSAARVEYGGEYENSLHFSPHFQDYSRSLAGYLVERFELRRRSILEIGCGKGEFLALLTDLGDNRGIGYDPSYRPGRIAPETAARVHIVADLFSPAQAVPADFICCRQVLEHLADPVGFLAGLRPLAEGRAVPVFFEVPNALSTLRDLGIWDLIYEHPSYFSPASLRQAFVAAGFEVLDVREAFSGQYLWIEAQAAPEGRRSAGRPSAEAAEVASLVDGFQERFSRRVGTWREKMAEARRLGRRAVIWGAGSKGVTFLNLLPAGEEMVGAVDLNPHKHGKFLPGTGQPVFSPDALPGEAPDLVIVMNPAYRGEIERHLDRLGIFPEVLSV